MLLILNRAKIINDFKCCDPRFHIGRNLTLIVGCSDLFDVPWFFCVWRWEMAFLICAVWGYWQLHFPLTNL